MAETSDLPIEPCPQCNGQTRVTATVHGGQWERHFFECRACELRFAGSWHSAHDAPAAAPQSSWRPAVVPPAA